MKIFKTKTIYGCEARGDAYLAYLTRWELISCKWFAIYLHKFHRSDDNSSLHDHPWSFITIPLWRGYYDCTFSGKTGEFGEIIYNRQKMKPFRAYYRPATHIHFVELFWDSIKGEEKEAWTFVIRFKYLRWWGFWNKGIFTRFDEYFEQKGC